eukprot:jgi/Astpho2/6831/fgenesh1_pg.00105_%23_15_t
MQQNAFAVRPLLWSWSGGSLLTTKEAKCLKVLMLAAAQGCPEKDSSLLQFTTATSPRGGHNGLGAVRAALSIDGGNMRGVGLSGCKGQALDGTVGTYGGLEEFWNEPGLQWDGVAGGARRWPSAVVPCAGPSQEAANTGALSDSVGRSKRQNLRQGKVRKDMRLSGFNRPLDCEQHFQRAIWKLHHSVVVGKLALRTLDLLLGITGGTQMPTKAQMLAQVHRPATPMKCEDANIVRGVEEHNHSHR